MRTRPCGNRKRAILNISLNESNKVFSRFSATAQKVREKNVITITQIKLKYSTRRMLVENASNHL